MELGKNYHVSVRLDKELWDKLKELRLGHGGKSNLIRLLIRKYFEGRKKDAR